MRFNSLLVLALTILSYSATCNLLRSEPVTSKSVSFQSNVVVLRPTSAILNENDGRALNVIEVKVNATDKVKNAQFVNTYTGWAGTNKSLHKTSDGGKTWEQLTLKLPPNSQLSSFYFIDEARGWLAVNSQVYTERYGFGNSCRILVSNDGGRSWAEQAVLAEEVQISYIKFLNANEGLAIGAKVVDQKPPYDEIFAVSTSDGGKKWNDISDRIKTAIKNEYGIANDFGASIYWSSPSRILLLTRLGRVISSTDQGETWKAIVQFKDERPNRSVSSTGFYKIVLATNEEIRVLGGASGEEGFWGDLIVNDNRGLWISYELIRIPISDAVFLSDNEVLACGKEVQPFDYKTNSRRPPVGIIMHSFDRGRSWDPVYRSKSNEAFIFLAKVGNDDFYAVSDAGTFLRFPLISR